MVELARQDELSESILKEVEGREKVRKELATLRKQRIEVQQKSRRLMDAIQVCKLSYSLTLVYCFTIEHVFTQPQ